MFKWLRNSRFWLAGPLVFICSVLVMAGAAVWFPQDAAKVNNIAIPLVLYPLIWSALFFYAYLAQSVVKAYAVVLGLMIFNVSLIYWHVAL